MGKFIATLLLLLPQNAFAIDAAQAEITKKVFLESKVVADQTTEEMGPCEGRCSKR